MPRRSRSQRAGFRAEAFVDKVVSDTGLIWNARHRDFGIDGQIEAVDVEGEVTGSFVLAQVKGTEVGFPGETADRFHFFCDARHIEYWQRCNHPVVLICVNLIRQEAWWKRVDTWFQDPILRARRVVDFNKTADRFDADSAAVIGSLSIPAGQPLPRLNRTERLTSNLLEVIAFGPLIHSASTSCRERGDAWERMRSNGSFESGFLLSGGRIYSMCSLTSGPLVVLCDGAVETFPTEQWSNADDPDAYRRFVTLLNNTLRAIHYRDLVWHAKKKVVYFKATPDLAARRIKRRSARGRGRSVFQPYFGNDDATKVRYCRHYAADLFFKRFDGRWFLEINPDYHFTIDGKRDSLYDAEYVKKIKRLERNSAVFALVRAWADFLRGEDTLFSRRDDRIVFGELAEFEADAAIDERAWIPPAPTEVAASVEELHLVRGLWDVTS
jgi:hypothetical protein